MSSPPAPRTPVSPPTALSVVPLTAARRSNAIRGPLWGTLVRLSLERVRSDLDEFLQKLDDSLFDLSGLDGTKGSAASASQHYFDSLRALRKQRAQVVDTVLNRIGDAWGRCEQSAAPSVEAARVPAAALGLPAGFTELSLLENEVLEESLAIAGAAQQVEGLVKGELLALQHRLAVLKGGVDPESVDVPITPSVILSAFRSGLDEIEMLPTEIKLIIYKLFERQVLARIPSLYQALNEALVQAGILGDWRPPSPVARTFARASAPPSGSGQDQGHATQAGAPEHHPGVNPSGPPHPPSRSPTLSAPHSGAGHPFAAPAPAGEQGWAGLPLDEQNMAGHPLWSILSQWMGAAAQPPASGTGSAPSALTPQSPSPSLGSTGFHGGPERPVGMGHFSPALQHAALTHSADPQAVMGVLRELLTPWRQASGLPQPVQNGVGDLGVPREEVLSALSWVRSMRQLGMLGTPTEASAAPNPGMSALQLKEELREVLKSQAQTLPSAPAPALGIHEDVIDMVGFLFEFVMSDSQLAPSLQADLGRLQLPYVRMALVEPDLFAKPDHPARLLLNALSEAGKGLTEGATDEASVAISGRIHAVIGTIAEEHDPDRSMFESELASFQTFVGNARRRAQIMERRLTETSVGQERKAASLRAVAAHVMPFVRDGNFPHWLSLMLLRSWSNALMLMHLKEGEASPGFAHGLAWMRDVRTLGQFPKGAEAQRRVESAWPMLQRTWTKALAVAGVSAEESERSGVALHRWLTNRATPGVQADHDPKSLEQAKQEVELERHAASRPVPGVTPDLHAGTALQIQTGTAPKPGTANPVSALPAKTPIVLPPEIAELNVGSWVEFQEPTPQRGKLIYISSFTQRLLFVDAQGAKLKEVSRSELAEALAAGQISLVSNTPLFERALGSVVRRLGEFKAKEQPKVGRPRAP